MDNNFIISFDRFDELYMAVNDIVENNDMPHYIMAIQKVLTNEFNKEEMTPEDLSVYFYNNILPQGNIQTIYQMLVEEAKRDINILDVRHIVEEEINTLFNADVAGATIDDLKKDFDSLDFDKLKSLLKIFVASN